MQKQFNIRFNKVGSLYEIVKTINNFYSIELSYNFVSDVFVHIYPILSQNNYRIFSTNVDKLPSKFYIQIDDKKYFCNAGAMMDDDYFSFISKAYDDSRSEDFADFV